MFEDIRFEVGDFHLSADLSLPAGSFAAILGPSGAGKSTLLSLVAGFLSPSSGRILWQGTDLTSRAPAQRPVSIVFQDHNLFPHLTVFDNVALGLSPSLRLASDDRDQVNRALTRVGLAGLGSRRPATLSGGQQSRVALARVLVRRRPLVLLDEPFSALGPALRGEMLDLVRDVAAETNATVLMVSHDPRDIRGMTDLTVFVDDGVAAPPVATDRIFSDPTPQQAAYLGDRGRR